MNTVLWRAGGLLSGVAAPKLVTREAAILLIMAAILLVYRTFRKPYLLVWILGWAAYLGAQFAGASSAQSPAISRVIAGGAFMLAVSLFVAGAFLYSQARFLLAPLVASAVLLAGFAGAQAIYWPDSVPLHFAFELSYRLLALSAAALLLRFRSARREVGPWILAAGLLSLHLDLWPLSVNLPGSAGIVTDVALGLGMLLVTLEQSRLCTRRLEVLNILAAGPAPVAGAGAEDAGLKQLKDLMRCNGVWLRLLQSGRLNIQQHAGLSPDSLERRWSIAATDSLECLPESAQTAIITNPSLGEYFPAERLRQIAVARIPGKKSPVGTLVLAHKHKRTYSPDELQFVLACATQFGMVLDRLHLVDEILRSHREWSNTFESIQDLVLLHDASFRILKANPALLSRVGKSQAEVVGQQCVSVLPRDEVKWSNCPYCRGEEEGFHEGPDPFGGFSVASTSTYLDQGTKQRATIHVIRDVSERRAAEHKYRSLFEQVQEGVFVISPAGKLLDCNDAFVRMLGHEGREAVLGCNVDNEFYVSREQRAIFRREVEAHDSVRDCEVRLRRKDGSELTAIESSFAIRDHEGKIESYHGFLLDITAKKLAEDEIRRRNRELNALNAMAVIATQSFDLDEILNLTLRQVLSLLGAETGSVYLAEPEERFRRRAQWGQRVTDRKRLTEAHFPDGLGELVMRARAEVLTAEYLPHLPVTVTDFMQAANGGSSIWVVLWGKDDPIGLMGISRSPANEYSNNDENLLLAIGRQLSTTVEKVRLYEETCKAYDDLRRTQEQLLQSEKMSAVGQLIAGVAHELNNPLTAILGYAQLLESEKLDPKALEYVGKIFKQGQRTHRVVQNLLSFARQRKPQKEQFDVIKVLEEALLLRDYDMKVGNIRLQRDFQADIPAVFGDPHQLEQVFLNVINNGIDAMTGEGPSEGNKPEHRFEVRVFAAESSVAIEFHDSGPGIQEPHRIFEPFYTTKNVGKGTGLGLSICYGIVKEHNGEISARNGGDGGAIIEIKLPSAGRAAVQQAIPETLPREMALKGSILLVEDEESVLEFERDVLSGAGAQVTTATSVETMKTLLAQGRFDAMIVNGKMPGATTVQETCTWLQDSYPQFTGHFLFTFSNLAETEVRQFLEQNHVRYLVKPFEVGDLITNTRRLMAKARGAAAGSS